MKQPGNSARVTSLPDGRYEVAIGSVDRKMGVRGVDTGELVLDQVRVPADNVVGSVGGFRLAMLGLNAMRPIVAARGIGIERAEGQLQVVVDRQRSLLARGVGDRRDDGAGRDVDLADHRLADLHRKAHACDKAHFREDCEREKSRGPKQGAMPIAARDRPADHASEHPGKKRQLNRAQDNQPDQQVALEGVGAHAAEQPCDEAEVERAIGLRGPGIFFGGLCRAHGLKRSCAAIALR